MDQVGADILSRKSTRAALNAWDTLQVLGEHPLATLRVVEARRRAMGRGDTPAGRGLSLRDVLRAAIEELAYDTGEPDYAEKGWRPFIILKEEFIDGRSADYLMDCLHIAQRTYQLERSMAIDRLGAGRGTRVVISNDGRGARELIGDNTTPARWSVIGVIDHD